jgi:predicted metal-binding protein
MDDPSTKLIEYAHQLGIETCVEFDSFLLKPEYRIRELCFENKCGKFKNHYMCPPYTGSLESIEEKLLEFRKCLLLQYSKPLDVRNDNAGLIRSKLEFHEKILALECFAEECGIPHALGLIGGNCELCEVCKAKTKEPCPYPAKARMSLESIAVDVMALLERFGLEGEFKPDRIKWTGCLLF